MTRIGARQKPFLDLAVGNLFETGGSIEIRRGPRGGRRGAVVTHPDKDPVEISASTVALMERRGFIKDGKVTEEGHNALLEHLRSD